MRTAQPLGGGAVQISHEAALEKTPIPKRLRHLCQPFFAVFGQQGLLVLFQGGSLGGVPRQCRQAYLDADELGAVGVPVFLQPVRENQTQVIVITVGGDLPEPGCFRHGLLPLLAPRMRDGQENDEALG